MIIYTQNEKYTIWTDENHLCFIQMRGGEVEPKGFDTAAKAMEEAEKCLSIIHTSQTLWA